MFVVPLVSYAWTCVDHLHQMLINLGGKKLFIIIFNYDSKWHVTNQYSKLFNHPKLRTWFYRVSLINFLSKSNNIIIQHWNDAEFKKKYITYQLQQIIVPFLLLHNV